MPRNPNAGRKAVPIEKRELEGTVRSRNRKKAVGAVVVDIKLIEEVPGLSKRAKAQWPFIRKCLHALPVTIESDVAAVKRLVETYAETQELQDEVIALGDDKFYTSFTKQGEIIRAHPAVAAYSDADRRLRAYLVEFGLTPAARVRVKDPNGGKDGDKSPLSEFL